MSHYRSPLEQIGDRIERLALLDRHPAAFGADTAAGRRRKRVEADDDDKLAIHLPDLLSLVLVEGKKDLGGKGTLVVPDNVAPVIPDAQPRKGVTRIVIDEGRPYIEAGRILDLLADLVSMSPVIPWIEFDNQFRWLSVRVEPWKTLTWEITR